jgi:hypothetical protein
MLLLPRLALPRRRRGLPPRRPGRPLPEGAHAVRFRSPFAPSISWFVRECGFRVSVPLVIAESGILE